MTASLMLLALGLKLLRRWISDICWAGWGLGAGEGGLAVDPCGVRVCDSSSILVEGSMAVEEVLVVLVL